MAAVKSSHQPLRRSAQKPLGACYGFPPPSSALRQTASPAKSLPQILPSPSPSPSIASRPHTPSPLSIPGHNYIVQDVRDPELQRVECGSNLAEYLAKNPGMKRLYNNHGSIKRPACVSCNESRKKCDLERPCSRCVKLELPCIERAPRAKKRKIDFDIPAIPPLQHCAPTHHHQPPQINQYGLPSPVSESQSETRVPTPMELDVEPVIVANSVNGHPLPAPHSTIHDSPNLSELGLCEEQAPYHSKVDRHSMKNTTDVVTPLDLLDAPPPMGSYIGGISSTPSGAPVFGLESSDSASKDSFLKELEIDLTVEAEDLVIAGANDLLYSMDFMASGSGGINLGLEGADMDALMEYVPSDQEIKDIMEWKDPDLDLETFCAQIDGMNDIFAQPDAPGANSSSAVPIYGWGMDWSIEN